MAKILFLEDENTIREVLSEYMRVAEHEVTECKNEEEAISLIDRGEIFDIAILDIRVPKVSGLDVLKRIKDRYGESVGTIMLTAYSDINTQIEAFNYEADDYIVKPASPIILLKRIQALYRRLKKSREFDNSSEVNLQNKHDDELIIDEDGYRAFYKGENLRLTVSEFSLMKILKDNRGTVFSRDILINKIFDDEYIANDRIIDAHIKNLRKKLPHDYIETVIGIGYRWRDEI